MDFEYFFVMGKAERERTKELEKLVLKINQDFNSSDNVLCLGNVNTGKHSFLKQLYSMTFSYMFTPELLAMQKIFIEKEVFTSISRLCSFIKRYQINVCSDTIQQLETELQQDEKDKAKIAELTDELYNNELVHDSFRYDNLKEFSREVYFLENIPKFFEESYVTSLEDLVHSSWKVNNFHVIRYKKTYSIALMPSSNYIKLAHSFYTGNSYSGSGGDFGQSPIIVYNTTKIVYFIDMLSLRYTISDNNIIWNEEQDYIEDINQLKQLNMLSNPDSFLILTKHDLFLEKLKKEGFNIEQTRYSIPNKYQLQVQLTNCIDSNSVNLAWENISKSTNICRG